LTLRGPERQQDNLGGNGNLLPRPAEEIWPIMPSPVTYRVVATALDRLGAEGGSIHAIPSKPVLVIRSRANGGRASSRHHLSWRAAEKMSSNDADRVATPEIRIESEQYGKSEREGEIRIEVVPAKRLRGRPNVV